jgi:hypothetical protein
VCSWENTADRYLFSLFIFVCLFVFVVVGFFPWCLASLPQTRGGISKLYMLDIPRSTVPWCLWLSSNISLYIFVYYLTLEFCWGHEVECSVEHIHKHRPLVTLADIQCFIHTSKYTIHLVQTKICSTRITFFVSVCDIVSLNLLDCTLEEIRYNSNTYAVLLLSIISIMDIYCL